MEFSDKKKDIPAEFRAIAIRVNKHHEALAFIGFSLSHYGYFAWPNREGSFKHSNTLFATLLDQDFFYMQCILFETLEPEFLILEIDTRKSISRDDVEVMFRECNILFSGDIFHFFEELKKYTKPINYNQIKGFLQWKIDELEDAKKDPAGYKEIINQRIKAKIAGNAEYFRNMEKKLSTNKPTNI